jgi:hypothetical protein
MLTGAMCQALFCTSHCHLGKKNGIKGKTFPCLSHDGKPTPQHRKSVPKNFNFFGKRAQHPRDEDDEPSMMARSLTPGKLPESPGAAFNTLEITCGYRDAN